MKKIEMHDHGTVKSFLYYNTHDGNVFIDIEEIKYCSGGVTKPMTIIYCENQKNSQPPYHTLREVEEVLNRDFFLRCHKSWLVNIKKAESVWIGERKILMQDGCILPVSRNRIHEVVQKAIEYQIPDKRFSKNK
jgi:DNA-binding LytR/AlgR family response regulator